MKNITFCCLFILAGQLSYSQSAITPVTKNTFIGKEMTVEEYMKQVDKTDKLVLVHFEADWCVLCKKLEPILKEIAVERIDKIEMLGVNTDENSKVAKHFAVDGLPIMILYKNGQIVWSLQGFISKKEILGILDVYQ